MDGYDWPFVCPDWDDEYVPPAAQSPCNHIWQNISLFRMKRVCTLCDQPHPED